MGQETILEQLEGIRAREAITKARNPEMHQSRGIIQWTIPPDEWVKVNTDGARNNQNGYATCSGIIRNNQGEWIRGFEKPKVIVETDNAEAFQLCSTGRRRMPAPTIMQHIEELVNRSWEAFSQTRREANRIADELAKLVRQDDFEGIVFQEPPRITLPHPQEKARPIGNIRLATE
ncbi:hypothetical protein F3Y22_tig00110556pilonHSYRG00635 [Hibiscus syriacus]|uniref:RNase H type-1 domain-containing protein n=1 Tax=Hibiscus syriacus TaxID=106335 RepID=A0A6A3ACZ0_HIBSY|nr:hypothetical protein F3Y22_tig00110556pilonHSYRG00635 [Hibiscus syriacus]